MIKVALVSGYGDILKINLTEYENISDVPEREFKNKKILTDYSINYEDNKVIITGIQHKKINIVHEYTNDIEDMLLNENQFKRLNELFIDLDIYYIDKCELNPWYVFFRTGVFKKHITGNYLRYGWYFLKKKEEVTIISNNYIVSEFFNIDKQLKEIYYA